MYKCIRLHLIMSMAVSPMLGRVQEYELENEFFSTYLECVQLFFLANGVEDDNKVPAFLSVVGSKTYSHLHNLTHSTCSAARQDLIIEKLFRIKVSDHC